MGDKLEEKTKEMKDTASQKWIIHSYIMVHILFNWDEVYEAVLRYLYENKATEIEE